MEEQPWYGFNHSLLKWYSFFEAKIITYVWTFSQHLAASKGYEDITLFLIQEGVDLNADDNFGNTPLLEAIKNGHDRVASLLSKEGALLKINNAGSFLCTVVGRGDSDFLRRLLSNGVDPNSNDYDHRSPLHVAASQGLYLMAKLLVEAGASVFSKDRYTFLCNRCFCYFFSFHELYITKIH